ncbi:MAG: TrmB family transcriptional regulator [Thermoplasmatota archaeon]
MTVNPQRVARLQEHGLTEYEARAYLALLELEKAEASQVADLSRVPRTKIYQALDGLEGKKLIKVVPERPKRYLVQPFMNYLDDLEGSLRNKAEELKGQKGALADEFASKGNVQFESAGGFIVLKGRANIASKLCELVSHATGEVSVATSGPGARRLAYHSQLFEERAKAGASVNLLAPITRENEGHLEPMLTSGASVCIRHATVDLGAMTIAFRDNREVLLVHHVPDDHHYFQGSDVALWSDDPALVAGLRTLFELTWNQGVAWADRKTAAPAASPMPALAKSMISAALASA